MQKHINPGEVKQTNRSLARIRHMRSLLHTSLVVGGTVGQGDPKGSASLSVLRGLSWRPLRLEALNRRCLSYPEGQLTSDPPTASTVPSPPATLPPRSNSAQSPEEHSRRPSDEPAESPQTFPRYVPARCGTAGSARPYESTHATPATFRRHVSTSTAWPRNWPQSGSPTGSATCSRSHTHPDPDGCAGNALPARTTSQYFRCGSNQSPLRLRSAPSRRAPPCPHPARPGLYPRRPPPRPRPAVRDSTGKAMDQLQWRQPVR